MAVIVTPPELGGGDAINVVSRNAFDSPVQWLGILLTSVVITIVFMQEFLKSGNGTI
jgi:hypothetical protein